MQFLFSSNCVLGPEQRELTRASGRSASDLMRGALWKRCGTGAVRFKSHGVAAQSYVRFGPEGDQRIESGYGSSRSRADVAGKCQLTHNR